MYSKSYAAGCLHFLAIVVESPAHDCLGSVLVRGSGWCRKRIRDSIVKLLVVGPVWATSKGVSSYPCLSRKDAAGVDNTYCDAFDIVGELIVRVGSGY
jgi:hypothetical protein